MAERFSSRSSSGKFGKTREKTEKHIEKLNEGLQKWRRKELLNDVEGNEESIPVENMAINTRLSTVGNAKTRFLYYNLFRSH